MKLGRVTHNRCAEYDCETFVVVPDGWTQEQFEEAVAQAEEKYIVAFEEFKAAKAKESKIEPVFLYGLNIDFIRKYPDKTYKEVKEIYDAKKAAFDAWNKEIDKGKRRFSYYLAEQGLTLVTDSDPDYETDVNWGHRHGQNLEYRDWVGSDIAGPYNSDDESFEYYLPNVKTRRLNETSDSS